MKLEMNTVLALDLTLYLNRVLSLLRKRGLFSLDVLAFLEIDFDAHRAEDEGCIMTILQKQASTSSRTNSSGFIVNSTWLMRWRAYVRMEGGVLGPIDNSILLNSASNNAPHLGLKPIRDYRIVSSNIWHTFLYIYTGGPALPRKGTCTIYDASYLDRFAATILLQRIARGFLARCLKYKKLQKMKRTIEMENSVSEQTMSYKNQSYM